MAGKGRKQPSLEEALSRLAQLDRGPIDDAARAELARAIESAGSLVVARAARVVKERSLSGFEKVLTAALGRFLINPVKSDPGCNAKLACLEALDTVDHSDPEPFLVASRHVQMEGSWGPPVDTATGLRARAVRALAHLGHRDIFLVAGELLGDPSPPVRQAAAEALAHAGDRGGAGMLLLAARRGDEDPVVHTAYLSALLALAPDWAVPRLRELLRGKDQDQRELAAIALGHSGRDDAASVLVEAMEATPLAAERALAVRGLGLHRSDRALDVLCGIIADGGAQDAEEAVRALSARRFDRGVRERVERLVGERGSLRLSQAFDEAFASAED